MVILDEGNRMSEKSWASLAPLLDNRRYIESIVAGVKVQAHPDFRLVATMNDDASTYELPEYIHSRLQPQIYLDFPDHDEEKQILSENLPFSDEQVLEYVTSFLQTLGLNHPKYNSLFKKAGPAYGLLIFVGNIAMPIAVLAGWVVK